ncbi:hypothetical protein GFS31_05360 [Leptolyngbya sp. BL0902]|nr:hypothetical protein GFS31_05360 [Leptolyngbya sp. BL0902]
MPCLLGVPRMANGPQESPFLAWVQGWGCIGNAVLVMLNW